MFYLAFLLNVSSELFDSRDSSISIYAAGAIGCFLNKQGLARSMTGIRAKTKINSESAI
jgi:hypothetical protein